MVATRLLVSASPMVGECRRSLLLPWSPLARRSLLLPWPNGGVKLVDHCRTPELNSIFFKALAAGGVPKTLAKTANFPKYLQLRFINFYDVDQISCALCLIKSSLNLQELEIWASTSADAAMKPVLNFLEHQQRKRLESFHSFSPQSINNCATLPISFFNANKDEKSKATGYCFRAVGNNN
ncbi:hypothetical protein F0562_033923 [Nyssa sinensis]|uniref:FBD domain-containing protein n=1 Tax=Nyssa sinensis TaxID=561372 RepID=A0A5J5AGH3_9ASTE|nr:hypothetical protein F0562_033923 [Nyssa sinensis]